jgi:hypothetical protein
MHCWKNRTEITYSISPKTKKAGQRPAIQSSNIFLLQLFFLIEIFSPVIPGPLPFVSPQSAPSFPTTSPFTPENFTL